MNLSLDSKHLLINAFAFLYFHNKILFNNVILLKGTLIPNWLNSSLASCSLINLKFLLLQTAHFDRSIVLPLLIFEILGFFLSVTPLHLKQYNAGAQLGSTEGGFHCPFLKIGKSALILVKKVLIVSILGLKLPFKM